MGDTARSPLGIELTYLARAVSPEPRAAALGR
jgi:hypothetical protein